jgi:hypothetical protein
VVGSADSVVATVSGVVGGTTGSVVRTIESATPGSATPGSVTPGSVVNEAAGVVVEGAAEGPEPPHPAANAVNTQIAATRAAEAGRRRRTRIGLHPRTGVGPVPGSPASASDNLEAVKKRLLLLVALVAFIAAAFRKLDKKK